jgi:hypothetical protein
MTDADGFAFFVGIDWGSQAHQVCVLDARGEILGEHPVLHTAAALEESLPLRWTGKSAQVVDCKGVAALHCGQRVRKRMKRKALDKDNAV